MDLGIEADNAAKKPPDNAERRNVCINTGKQKKANLKKPRNLPKIFHVYPRQRSWEIDNLTDFFFSNFIKRNRHLTSNLFNEILKLLTFT